MLARKLPFDGATPSAVLTKLIDEEPPALLECVPDLPPKLAQLIHRMLAKSPKERPETAAFVRAELAQLELERCKLSKAPPGTAGQTGRTHSDPPASSSETVDEISWPAISSSLQEWPSVRVTLRYKRKPAISRRTFLFWSAVAAASGIGAAVYLIVRESRKQGRPAPSKGTGNRNR
jgi:hypothetical protein